MSSIWACLYQNKTHKQLMSDVYLTSISFDKHVSSIYFIFRESLLSSNWTPKNFNFRKIVIKGDFQKWKKPQ